MSIYDVSGIVKVEPKQEEEVNASLVETAFVKNEISTLIKEESNENGVFSSSAGCVEDRKLFQRNKTINMESDSDSDLELTPPSITEAANLTTLNLLPETSKKIYKRAYNLFLEWKGDRNAKSFSENVLMAYFGDLAKKFKSSTLWTQYSMLRTTLSIHNNIDIAKYLKLKAFLKRQSDGYRPKKSKIFTSNDINKFIKEAPDEIYLATKVALIMGIMGACRRHELHQMKITNFNDLGSAVLITIPDTKNKTIRAFTVTSPYYEIYKKYANLRPSNVNGTWFFINYQKGKCTVQRIGMNKLGGMGKEIAKYLNLPNHELYTGHCFRRSSATILVDAGGDITNLKRHGGWKSTTVAEGYIDNSEKNKFDTANKIVNAIQSISNIPSTSGIGNREMPSNTSTMENCQYQENFSIQHSTSSPKMIFNNCTFNFNNK